MRLIGELILSHELDTIKTTAFQSPVYCGDCLNISKIWADSGISELLFSITRYKFQNAGYQKDKANKDNPEIDEYFSEYISSLRVPASICIKPSIRLCDRLFDLGFDRVGFNYNLNNTEKIYQALKYISTRYGGQATFLIYEMKFTHSDIENLSNVIDTIQEYGVGEIIIKDVLAENKCVNPSNVDVISMIMKEREIRFGYSGGIKFSDVCSEHFQDFSSLSIGGDITFVKQNKVMPGF